jgi:hypothetical protein
MSVRKLPVASRAYAESGDRAFPEADRVWEGPLIKSHVYNNRCGSSVVGFPTIVNAWGIGGPVPLNLGPAEGADEIGRSHPRRGRRGDRLHCGMRRRTHGRTSADASGPAESRSAAVVRADTVEFAPQREHKHVQPLPRLRMHDGALALEAHFDAVWTMGGNWMHGSSLSSQLARRLRGELC